MFIICHIARFQMFIFNSSLFISIKRKTNSMQPKPLQLIFLLDFNIIMPSMLRFYKWSNSLKFLTKILKPFII